MVQFPAGAFMTLKLLASFILLVTLLFAVSGVYLWWNFRHLITTLFRIRGASLTPLEISLVKTSPELWNNYPNAQRHLDELKDIGFERLNVYNIPEMPQFSVTTFQEADSGALAYLCCRTTDIKSPTFWVDMVIVFEDERKVVCTTVPDYGVRIVPDWIERVDFPPETPYSKLFQILKEKRATNRIKALSSDDVAIHFQNEYRRTMQWRHERQGGTSKEEVRDVARSSGLVCSEEELDQAFLGQKLEEIFQYHEYATRSVVEMAGLKDSSTQDHHIIFGKKLNPEAYAHYLSILLAAPQSVQTDLLQLARNGASAEELFVRVQSPEGLGRFLTQAGTSTFPLPLEVFRMEPSRVQ